MSSGPAIRAGKAALVQQYQQWNDAGRNTSITPAILAGLFYTRYKQRYRLYPVSDEKDDLRHFQVMLNQYVSEDPALAPYMVDVLCNEKNFQNLQPSSFSNSKVIAGWRVIEKASALRTGFGVPGEQSEFAGSRATFGVTRV